MKIWAGLNIVFAWGALVVLFLLAPLADPHIMSVLRTPETLTADMRAEKLERLRQQAEVDANQIYAAHDCVLRGKTTARAAMQENVSAKLIAAVVVVESHCNPVAVSKSGALGLMQVMPSVWKIHPHELFDPDRNIYIGTRILSTYVRESGTIEGLRRYKGYPNSAEAYRYARLVLNVAGIKP